MINSGSSWSCFRVPWAAISLLILSSLLDYRSDLKPTDIAEEFDRMWEMWARGIVYLEGKDSGNGRNCLQVVSLALDNLALRIKLGNNQMKP